MNLSKVSFFLSNPILLLHPNYIFIAILCDKIDICTIKMRGILCVTEERVLSAILPSFEIFYYSLILLNSMAIDFKILRAKLQRRQFGSTT